MNTTIDPRLSAEVDAAVKRLSDKLSKVDVQSLPLSDYNKRYVRQLVSSLPGHFQCYAHLLKLALAAGMDHSYVIDYGAGWGGLALLAAELGVPVIYDDIYDVSCRDAGMIAAAVGLEFAHVVCGDIDDLVAYTVAHELSCAAMVSYDVLEHIYDVPHYLQTLSDIPGARFRVVLASGANQHNPRIRRRLMVHHRMRETMGKEHQWGHKERDALRSYRDIRSEMIAEQAPHLSAAEIEVLAKLTRGLMRDDISAAVDEYLKRGSISYQPDHPTNTCDPNTGNWAEHLMDTGWLCKHLAAAGFEATVLPGYWVASPSPLRSIVGQTLNAVMPLLGRHALTLAPYYILKGERPDHALANRSAGRV
ncbi:MAG: hypothetical protein DCC55_20695 [Chloroflexi bacterium]|nr:MAG: hypothetical protein DCC55_20695 [Chloroflexota bacterium]